MHFKYNSNDIITRPNYISFVSFSGENNTVYDRGILAEIIKKIYLYTYTEYTLVAIRQISERSQIRGYNRTV